MNEPAKPFPPFKSVKRYKERVIFQTTLITSEEDEDEIIENYFDEVEDRDSLNIRDWSYDTDIITMDKIMALIPDMPLNVEKANIIYEQIEEIMSKEKKTYPSSGIRA